jgi:hypothetical protein
MDSESSSGIFFGGDMKESLYNMVGESFKGVHYASPPKPSSTNAVKTGQIYLQMETHSR